MTWDLRIGPSVPKRLKKFPRSDSERILKALESMSDNPYMGDVRKMEGAENRWRKRVGSYRILFEIFSNEKVILVVAVKRRTSKTY